MAHFAQLDQNNIVIQTIVVSNDELDNLPFPESETKGILFCKSLFGENTNWAQTSYTAAFRYNYAGEGFLFDSSANPNGAFIPPKPYSSWLLNTNNFCWQAPVPYPTDGKIYTWNEESQSWVEIT